MLIPRQRIALPVTERPARQSLLGDIGAGLRYLWDHRLVRLALHIQAHRKMKKKEAKSNRVVASTSHL
ncbi:MAG: hypothetical protein H0X24_04045 [Ktedonobacterales bacterium]|nr:hypothetical protein [Ktedonobacterales bacterium]